MPLVGGGAGGNAGILVGNGGDGGNAGRGLFFRGTPGAGSLLLLGAPGNMR